MTRLTVQGELSAECAPSLEELMVEVEERVDAVAKLKTTSPHRLLGVWFGGAGVDREAFLLALEREYFPGMTHAALSSVAGQVLFFQQVLAELDQALLVHAATVAVSEAELYDPNKCRPLRDDRKHIEGMSPHV